MFPDPVDVLIVSWLSSVKNWIKSLTSKRNYFSVCRINRSNPVTLPIEKKWFPFIPHNSFEKLSDTSYKFIVDIPTSKHASKYFPSKFDYIIINKENVCYLRSVISEEQYNNWKYIMIESMSDLNMLLTLNTIFTRESSFSISKEEEIYYLDISIFTENYIMIATLFNSFVIEVLNSLIILEDKAYSNYRKIEISKEWESINDCFLNLIDISDHVESSKENNSYTFYLNGLDVIPQSESVRIPYGKSHGGSKTVNFDSAKFYLTNKMFESIMFLKEAQDRILDIIPDCIIQIEINSKYLKVTLK
jgi:hypothetical protein